MDLDRRTLLIGLLVAAVIAIAIGAAGWATAGEASRKGYIAATFGCLGFSAAVLLLVTIVFAVNWAHRNGGGWLGLVWRYPVAVLGVLVFLLVMALLVFAESGSSSNPSSGYFGNQESVVDGATGIVIAAIVIPAIVGAVLSQSI